MTEICNGYFDPVIGDQSKQAVSKGDEYHPRYPDTKITGTLRSLVTPNSNQGVEGYDCTAPKAVGK